MKQHDIRDLVRLDDLTESDVAEVLPPHHPKAGRPKGRTESRRSVLSRRIVLAALESGNSPLHVLLSNQAWFQTRANELEQELRESPEPINRLEAAQLRYKAKMAATFRKLACDVAAAAAPYCHPRLHAISAEGGSDGTPIIFNITSDDSRL
jgi:hypothetical protein